MKKLYYFQFLFLVSFVSVDCAVPSLSPSRLAEKRDEIQGALARLSPLNKQTMAQACSFYEETYSHSPEIFKRIYLTTEQEAKELKKIRDAYALLCSHGFQNATRAEIESSLSAEVNSPDIFSCSFNRRSFGAIDLQIQRQSCQFEYQPFVLPVDIQEIAGAITSSSTQQAQSIFTDQDKALAFLGFNSGQKPSWDMIESKMGLLEIDNAIGIISDEYIIRAKEAVEYLRISLYR